MAWWLDDDNHSPSVLLLVACFVALLLGYVAGFMGSFFADDFREDLAPDHLEAPLAPND